MKRSGFTLWKWLVSGATLLLVAAILFPIFARPPVNPGRLPNCSNQLKQIGLALAQYSQDYHERLPRIIGASEPAAGKPYGWADAIFPYIKSPQLFHCPSLWKTREGGKTALPTDHGYTDYWLNSNLSGLALTGVKDPKQTITFGDGNDGIALTDARYNLPSLPAAWLSDQNSPAYRHDGGANYAFLDMHVKWLKPSEMTAGKATFSPK